MKEQDPRGGGQYPYAAKEIRKALESVDTRLKIEFTKFCKENGITHKEDGWKLIPPENEVERVANAMKEALAKYDLDYKTLDSIWPPYEKEVIQAAKDAMQSIRRDKYQQSIDADLSELLKREKPLFSAQNVTTEVYSGSYLNANDLEAIMNTYEDVNITSKMISNTPVEMKMLVNPMHVQWPNALSYANITAPIHEVVPLNYGGKAIVTDRAIFVTDQPGFYNEAMIDTYKDWLKGQDIQLPICYEKEGYDQIMQYYTLPEHAVMDAIFANQYNSTSQNIETLNNYLCRENTEDRASAFVLSDPNGLITAVLGDIEIQVQFEDIQPGMMLHIQPDQTKTMDLVESSIDNPQIQQACVLGQTNINGDKVLITNAGILACKDLSQELGFEVNRDHGHVIE